MNRYFNEISIAADHFVDQIGEGVFLYDSSGTILDVNQIAIDKLNYEREELLNGKKIWEVEVGRSPDQLQNLFDEMDPGETRTLSGQHREANGRTFPVESRLHCFRHEDQKMYTLLARDTTIRKREREDLQQKNRRFRTLYENSPVGVWESDWSAVKSFLDQVLPEEIEDVESYLRDHSALVREAISRINVLNVNEALLELLEAPNRETLIHEFPRMIPETSQAIFRGDFVAFLEGALQTDPHEISLQTFQGNEKTILRKTSLRPEHRSDWSRLFVSYQDITELQNQREKIQEQAHLLDAVNNYMPGVSHQLVRHPNGDYEFTYMSEGFEELAGVPTSVALEDFEDAAQHMHPDDIEQVIVQTEASAETLTEFRLEVRYLLPDGTQNWGLLCSQPEKLDDGTVRWSGVALDITEQKKTQKELEKKANQKETLLQEVHHRVKNNMQVISSLLGLQSQEITDPEARSLLKNVKKRVQSMALVHQILYESEQFDTLDAAEYLQQLAEGVTKSFRSKSTQIALQFELEGGITLKPEKAIPCGLITSELLTNSMKYAVDEDDTAHSLFISLSEGDNGRYELVVSDEGPGLPEDVEPGNTSSLGLRLVDNLVKNQLKGDYSIDREGGTTFNIQFTPVRD